MNIQNLVLVPGLVCDAQVWRHQTRYLGDIATISIASVPGHETMAEMAADALNNTPDKFAIAGFSMGGYVALEMLRQAPERY